MNVPTMLVCTRPKLTSEADWWDRTRAEYMPITITITMFVIDRAGAERGGWVSPSTSVRHG